MSLNKGLNKKTAAYIAAGWRERFAMEHGNRTVVCVHGHRCYKYTYSKRIEYQDANGAIFDPVINKWIG